MPNLGGLHDKESVAIAPPDTWALDTVALSENPPPAAYPTSLNWIARLNWGYGSTGTIPVPGQYQMFAQRVAAYVNASRNCTRWIIGNEPSLPREWAAPAGGPPQPIFPWDYTACYKLCRQAIHALPGHAGDEVLIAASGPWNNDCKYSTNPNGDWITYFADVINLLMHEFDGCALHAYTHGYDPSLVTSTAKMDAPFQNHYFNFRTYQDYIRVIPEAFWHLPVYITEANGNGPWQAVGLMPAMLHEINEWNEMVKDGRLPTIRSVIFYRYPRYDQFFIDGRDDVIAEYRAAVSKGYQSPMPVQPAPQPPMPEPSPPTPTPPAPQRDIDPRLIARGVRFDFATPPAGTKYWRITKAQWLEDAAHQVGPDHHGIGEVLRDGKEVADIPILVTWPSDSTTVISKADDPNASYNWNYAMSASLNEFSFHVNDGNPTDKVSGVGMGKDGNPKEHTSTWITWAFVAATEPIPPDPTPDPPTPPIVAGLLIWPVQGPITQRFGENPADYAKFGQAGHNAVDIGVPEGTPVRCIADGEVMFTGVDPDYGNYARVWIPSLGSHAFFAHLSAIQCTVGQQVKQGQVIAASGNTGNSSGPHVHFELRGGSRDAYYAGSFGYTQGRYDPQIAYLLTGSALTPGATLDRA